MKLWAKYWCWLYSSSSTSKSCYLNYCSKTFYRLFFKICFRLYLWKVPCICYAGQHIPENREVNISASDWRPASDANASISVKIRVEIFGWTKPASVVSQLDCGSGLAVLLWFVVLLGGSSASDRVIEGVFNIPDRRWELCTRAYKSADGPFKSWISTYWDILVSKSIWLRIVHHSVAVMNR